MSDKEDATKVLVRYIDTKSIAVSVVAKDKTAMLMELFKRGLVEYDDFYGAKPPFEMNEYAYIEYALADFRMAHVAQEDGERTRHLINCVSNTKRALDCRVDTFIEQWGLGSVVKKDKRIKNANGEGVRSGAVAKMQALQNANILAPTILRKIRDYRNNIEHHYSRPDINQVEEYLDIVRLFLSSSRKAMHASIRGTSFSEQTMKPRGALIKNAREHIYPMHVYSVSISLDKGNSSIDLEYFISGDVRDNVRIFAEHDLERYFKVLSDWYYMLEFY